MQRRTLLSTGLGLAAAGTAASLGIPAARADDKVTWNWNLYGPPRAVTVCMEHIAKVAKEKTNGNFIINLKYHEQLGDV